MTTPLQLPPRACPLCLFGLCHRCTGRLVVLDVRGVGRDEACEHRHRPGRGPVAPDYRAGLFGGGS